MRVLVTGASGFVAGRVIPVLSESGFRVRAATRTAMSFPGNKQVEPASVGEIGPDTDWGSALEGIDAVVHLAGRAHVMAETEAKPLAAYRRVNLEGTRKLAEQAVAVGVHRFVYMSSVKVNGERTTPEHPFTEADTPAPEDAYGQSKWEAEQALHDIGREHGLEVVVLRPPLVYGPGVKGNFLKLLSLCDKAPPLPLASACNHRSFIHVGNLADAVRLCLSHPAAGGETFLLRDGQDLSTPELIRGLASALGRPVRLFPAPRPLLRGLAAAVGRRATAARLLESLVIDDRKILELLAWQPPFGVLEGLTETAAWFASRNRR